MNAPTPKPLPQYHTLKPSELLPVLAVSLSLTAAGKVADNLWLTWTQVCQAFKDCAQRVSDTKDGMLICFAQFANDYRIGSIATDLYAVCLDFDHGTTEQLNASIALAQRLSTRGIVHTTWSDDPVHLSDPHRGRPVADARDVSDPQDNRCWRVIIPLDVPASAADWPAVWQMFAFAFAAQAGAEADIICKNINRRYYVPSIRKGQASTISPFDVTLAVPTLWTWGE